MDGLYTTANRVGTSYTGTLYAPGQPQCDQPTGGYNFAWRRNGQQQWYMQGGGTNIASVSWADGTICALEVPDLFPLDVAIGFSSVRQCTTFPSGSAAVVGAGLKITVETAATEGRANVCLDKDGDTTGLNRVCFNTDASANIDPTLIMPDTGAAYQAYLSTEWPVHKVIENAAARYFTLSNTPTPESDRLSAYFSTVQQNLYYQFSLKRNGNPQPLWSVGFHTTVGSEVFDLSFAYRGQGAAYASGNCDPTPVQSRMRINREQRIDCKLMVLATQQAITRSWVIFTQASERVGRANVCMAWADQLSDGVCFRVDAAGNLDRDLIPWVQN